MSRRYKYNTLLLENGRNVYIGIQPNRHIHILFSNGETDYKLCCRRWLEKRVVKEYSLLDMSRRKIAKQHHTGMTLIPIETFANRN